MFCPDSTYFRRTSSTTVTSGMIFEATNPLLFAGSDSKASEAPPFLESRQGDSTTGQILRWFYMA
jgi:hypothetical protein